MSESAPQVLGRSSMHDAFHSHARSTASSVAEQTPQPVYANKTKNH